MEADPETIIDVCEELSFADGSVGWAFAQNTTVLAYSAYVAPEYGAPLAAARAGAGMFAPLGVAHREAGGYRVSGQYPFGSGSGHADYMGGSALVMQDGEMVMNGGLLEMRGFIVPAERCTLKGNWDVIGLRGTGSFDFEFPEQRVEEGMTFPVFHYQTITGGPLYGLGPIVVGTLSSAYEASGSHGMRNPSRLQRCFRDIYVGAAHQPFDERNFQEQAKASLGLEPAPF
jgi:alkylation response protein AidB-like acyl-CoA dehydrogenase